MRFLAGEVFASLAAVVVAQHTNGDDSQNRNEHVCLDSYASLTIDIKTPELSEVSAFGSNVGKIIGSRTHHGSIEPRLVHDSSRHGTLRH